MTQIRKFDATRIHLHGKGNMKTICVTSPHRHGKQLFGTFRYCKIYRDEGGIILESDEGRNHKW